MQYKLRILALGDSFTFGPPPEIGKSYIETIESSIADVVVWNMGLPGVGTKQAVQSYEVYGPIMNPDITLLGFYTNDFQDNMVPIRGQLITTDEGEEQLFHWEDRWGSSIVLDSAATRYYRKHLLVPPGSHIEWLFGTTRLGTLVLRMFDIVGLTINQGIRTSREIEVTREYLQSLRDATIESGSSLLVLLIPGRADLPEPGQMYKTAIQLMRALDIAYVDPSSILDADTDYAPDLHWNAVGNHKIGTLLSSCLQAINIENDLTACEYVNLP